MGRFPLQVCTVVLSLIPIITGVVTLLGIKDPLYRPLGLPSAPILDSNLRFFCGVWFGLGLAMLWFGASDRAPRGPLSSVVGSNLPGRGRARAVLAPDRDAT